MTTITTTEILALRLLTRIQKKYNFNLQESYRDWAYTQLENGIDSVNINVLAGLTSFDNYFETESYFLKALHDLNIQIPPDEIAVKNYARLICNKILNNEISEADGCHLLATICLDRDYSPEYRVWLDIEENPGQQLPENDIAQLIRKYALEFSKTNS